MTTTARKPGCAFCTTLERHGYHHPRCPGPRIDREHDERMKAVLEQFKVGVRAAFQEVLTQGTSSTQGEGK